MAGAITMPPSNRDLASKVAIVGIGETDYGLDYKAARAKAPGWTPSTVEELTKLAFERALADAGLRRADIDGLSVSFTNGGPSATSMAQNLGLVPSFLIENGGIMAGPIPAVCREILAGKCDTVAMIYGVSSRSSIQFGGTTYQGGGAPSSYYYHLPWGWSSQAAHWAFIWSHYQAVYSATEEDLGAVAVQIRKHALANSNAVMQVPLSLEDYLQSRYIVRPMHLFDLCMVNDGAVCLIVRRSDKAGDLLHTPVLVAGWAEADVKTAKLNSLIRERLRPQMQDAGERALHMADLEVNDIEHLEGYDVSTIHLINQLEGYGFCEPGAGLEFCKGGHMAIGGKLPVNTGGGQLSDSHMHGWNQIVEITRQLRHEAGPRQIEGIQTSMFSLAQTDAVHPLVFRRGG